MRIRKLRSQEEQVPCNQLINGRAPARGWFVAGCLAEASLLGFAGLLGWLLHLPLFSTLHWSWVDLGWGLAGVTPLALMFAWMLHSTLDPLRAIRTFLEQRLRPIMGTWHWSQLLLISLIAGIAEESLFRPVIQGGLATVAHPLVALGAASLLFGLCHAMSWAYAVIAAAIGAYLGLLWILSGNLLTPMVTHAVYDFAALVYFLRRDCTGRMPG